jgi:hypothetical protein
MEPTNIQLDIKLDKANSTFKPGVFRNLISI